MCLPYDIQRFKSLCNYTVSHALFGRWWYTTYSTNWDSMKWDCNLCKPVGSFWNREFSNHSVIDFKSKRVDKICQRWIRIHLKVRGSKALAIRCFAIHNFKVYDFNVFGKPCRSQRRIRERERERERSEGASEWYSWVTLEKKTSLIVQLDCLCTALAYKRSSYHSSAQMLVSFWSWLWRLGISDSVQVCTEYIWHSRGTN